MQSNVVPLERIIADEHKDRPHWLEQRRQFVTGSEVPCLFDAGYITREHLALLKRGEVEPDPPNIHMRLGSFLEPFLYELLLEEKPHMAMQRCGQLIVDARQPRLAATPDVVAYVGTRIVPVQLKHSGYSPKRLAEDMPPYFQLQLQAEMAVLDAPTSYVACLHKFARGEQSPFQLYEVPRDDKLVGDIRDAVSTFWAEEMAT